MEQYRGITISPVLSKIFEFIILDFIRPHLTTSKGQFGFKKGNSCAHAIYTVRKTTEVFCSQNSTVNICTLDISKAFDKVNHNKLILQLLKRKVPLDVILLIRCWYAKIVSCVRWGNALSKFVNIKAGVRQGGILSPFLFSIYVDNVLKCLRSSGLGCYIKGICFNSVMYADDLILMSISISHLQRLIHICEECLGKLDLEINGSKSFILRVGPRYNHVDIYITVVLNGNRVKFCNEINYLGVYLVTGKRLKINIQKSIHKFYRAANSIFGKIVTFTSPMVVLSLINASCVPILLYGLNAFKLNKSELGKIDDTLNSIFYKLFKVNSKENIRLCQFYFKFLPATYLVKYNVYNFLDGLRKNGDSLPYILLKLYGTNEVEEILQEFDITSTSIDTVNIKNVKSYFVSHFEQMCNG